MFELSDFLLACGWLLVWLTLGVGIPIGVWIEHRAGRSYFGSCRLTGWLLALAWFSVHAGMAALPFLPETGL